MDQEPLDDQWPELSVNRKPTVSVSVSMKIQTAPYESADAFISLSGLTTDATDEEIEELLDTGRLAWSAITRRLGAKVAELRGGAYFDLEESQSPHDQGTAGNMPQSHQAPPQVQRPPQQQPPAPQPTQAPTGPVWVQNPDGTRSCTVHGLGKLIPAGVSKKTNKPYDAFWTCQAKDCKPAGNAWT